MTQPYGRVLHVWGVPAPIPPPCTSPDTKNTTVGSRHSCLHPSLHLYHPDTKNATTWSRSSHLAVFPQQPLDRSPQFSFNPDTKMRRVFVSGVFPYLDYFSILYILSRKIQIMSFLKKNNLRFQSESTWNRSDSEQTISTRN